LKSARVRCGGGKLLPEYGPGEVDIRGVVCVPRLVLQCAVMVVVPVGDGCLVEGGLIQGGMHPTEPSQRCDGLGGDNEQR
jgi:hypothetical protein